jgi:hypothetical protein
MMPTLLLAIIRLVRKADQVPSMIKNSRSAGLVNIDDEINRFKSLLASSGNKITAKLIDEDEAL